MLQMRDVKLGDRVDQCANHVMQRPCHESVIARGRVVSRAGVTFVERHDLDESLSEAAERHARPFHYAFLWGFFAYVVVVVQVHNGFYGRCLPSLQSHHLDLEVRPQLLLRGSGRALVYNSRPRVGSDQTVPEYLAHSVPIFRPPVYAVHVTRRELPTVNDRLNKRPPVVSRVSAQHVNRPCGRFEPFPVTCPDRVQSPPRRTLPGPYQVLVALPVRGSSVEIRLFAHACQQPYIECSHGKGLQKTIRFLSVRQRLVDVRSLLGSVYAIDLVLTRVVSVRVICSCPRCEWPNHRNVRAGAGRLRSFTRIPVRPIVSTPSSPVFVRLSASRIL